MVRPVGLGVEDALYDSNAMLDFAGIDLGREPVPNETTVCKFRHLLERRELCGRIFAEVNAYLAQQEDAVRQRDPEMHQLPAQ